MGLQKSGRGSNPSCNEGSCLSDISPVEVASKYLEEWAITFCQA
jgi:hypothetical protein